MKKSKVIFLILLMIFLEPVACSSVPPSNRYMLLISIDCMNQREFFKYTREHPVMPHLAKLAKDSIVFTKGYAHAPWTLPSHMSMLTGLYPYQHGRDVPVFMLEEEDVVIKRRKLLNPTIADHAVSNGFEAVAFTGSGSIPGIYGLGKGFTLYDESIRSAGKRKRYDSPNSAPKAVAWIKKNYRKPFFLFYHTYDLHHSPELPEDFATVDHSIGSILTALKEKGIYDKSCIILTGDHGRDVIRKNNKCSAHGVGHYEENLNVPYILKLPGQKWAGKETDILVRHVDFFPTFFDALDIKYDDYEGPGVSVIERLERVEQGIASDEVASLSQYDTYCVRKEAVRWSHYKYIRQLMDPFSQQLKENEKFSDSRCEGCDNATVEELYDIAADPWEVNNLVGENGMTHILEEGRNRLAKQKSYDVKYVEDTTILNDKPDDQVKESLKSLGYIN